MRTAADSVKVVQPPQHADPPEELFEVLCPETERVTGLQPRGKCHREGLLHRAGALGARREAYTV